MINVKGHRLLVKEDSVETVSEGGIVVVVKEDLERAALQTGVICGLGEDCWKAFRKVDENGLEKNGQPWANIGDYVIFARHAGRFIKDPTNGDEFLIMNDEDILGVITEGSTPIQDNVLQKKANKGK